MLLLRHSNCKAGDTQEVCRQALQRILRMTDPVFRVARVPLSRRLPLRELPPGEEEGPHLSLSALGSRNPTAPTSERALCEGGSVECVGQ